MFEESSHHDFENAAALFGMGVLASFEYDRDLHFVFILQKANRLLDLEVDVVIACLGMQTNFLEARLMNVLVSFLLLFVFVLAEVHDSADRRALVGGDFHEIQSHVSGAVHSLIGRENAELFSGLADHADGRNADLLINPGRNAVDCWTLS